MAPLQPIVRFFGIAVLAYMAVGCGTQQSALTVGNPIPDFSVVSVADPVQKIGLKELKGKAILIDFWATWCGPCRESLPHLQELWQANKDKGLEFLAISNEDLPTVTGFQSQEHLEVPFFVDAEDKANQDFGVTAFPTTLVVGKDGRVVYVVEGTGPGVQQELEAAVAKALQ